MKYLLLIYSNPSSRDAWSGLSEAQQKETVGGYIALNDELAATGEKIVSASLADGSGAKQVTIRQGRTVTTDGPFAELKEELAGFYFVDCASIERAIEIAARIPEGASGRVEVRPIRDLSALGL